MSPTVFRYRNYRFFFFSREENRMHVHVISPDGEAKFWIEPEVEMAVNKGLGSTELTELKLIVEERKKMKSENIGSGTLAAEVLNVSPHGFWLMAGGREYFLSVDHFPWFRGATLKQLFNVELHHGDHFYWPEIDVDLDLERITHPEKFPLIAKTGN